MELLEAFLHRVVQKMDEIENVHELMSDRYDRNRFLERLRDPSLNRETHCATCGLPRGHHVPHDPPDVPKPDGSAPAKDWAPYIQAQKAAYRTALQALSTGDLLALPLPISVRRLEQIAEEVRDRIKQGPPSRYARLGSDDDWL